MQCETNSRTEKPPANSSSQRSITYQTWCGDCKEEDEEKLPNENEYGVSTTHTGKMKTK